MNVEIKDGRLVQVKGMKDSSATASIDRAYNALSNVALELRKSIQLSTPEEKVPVSKALALVKKAIGELEGT